MSRFLRLTAFLFSFCILAGVTYFPASADTSEALALSAHSAVLIDADSGSVLYAKNANERLPMASTTKIMTAYVALALAKPEHVIRTDAGAVGIEGSSIYLSEGEELTLEQLLYALLLESANDAAAAIAIGLSGSVEAFADEMNRKAQSLGLTNTHFTNPHGLHDEAHYTTAHELALLSHVALQNELIQTIVSTRKTTIPHAGSDGVRLLVNHNKMLRLYDGCIGVKTGFTKQSGRCLVSAAERDGVRLIAVTIDAPNDWNDHTAMLDYGFARYRSVKLCDKAFLYPLPLVNATEDYVMLGVEEDVCITLPNEAGEIQQVVECRRFESAPVFQGDVCGRMLFYCDADGDGVRECIAELPMVACYSVEVKPDTRTFWQKILDWWASLFL